MTKQEFMAFSLPYGLKYKELGLNEKFTLNPKLYSLIELLNWSNVYQPLLHPLSDLNKPIEHKGEKFVPIMELAKFLYKRISIAESFKLRGDRVYFESISYNYFWYSKEMKCFCSMFENSDILVPVHNQLELFQQLLKWHFDLFGGIESGEAIDVNTLEINPYK